MSYETTTVGPCPICGERSTFTWLVVTTDQVGEVRREVVRISCPNGTRADHHPESAGN